MMNSRATYSNPEYSSDSAGSSLNKEFYPIGFKQTDCGAIPLDWHVFSLQNLCRAPITYGIVQCGPHIEGGVPYIRVSDMNSNELDTSNMLRTAPAIAASFSRSRVEDGDIVYALRGLLGTVKIVRDDVVGANLTQGTARIAPGNNIYNNYLYWALRSEGVIKQAIREAKGSTFIEITLANLKDIKIPVPENVEEQTAIANALSDVDALIQELEKLIAKKQAIKTATMQQLLTGRTRLPLFAHHPDGRKKGYKPSELGEIPEDWVIRCLGDICYLKSGLGITATELDEHGEYPCYGGNGLRGYTNRFTHEGEYVLVGRQGALCGNVQHVLGCFFASEHALVATPLGGVNSKWLSIYLERMNLNQYSESSAQPGLSAEKLKVLKLITPPAEEQQAVAEVLYEMEDEIRGIEQRLHKTRQIKQGMMQELLIGKTRLIQRSETI